MNFPAIESMLTIKKLMLAGLVAFAAAGCQDDESTVAPGENTRLEIGSDPSGATIELNGAPTGKVTPSTIFDIAGSQDIVVRLERDGVIYGYRADNVDVRGDSLHRVFGPLMYRCSNSSCAISSSRSRDLGRLRVATQANGAIFMRSGQGDGLLWPLGSSNSYASIGMPLIAMVSGINDTLAIGIYDTDYLAGRPEPTVTVAGERTTVKQSTWIVPPTNVIINNSPTVRGIEVEEELIGTAGSDVVYLKLTYRNITNRESYRAADPVVPGNGMTFQNVYVGFGLDPDIGTPGDDMITYEPDLDLVYAYDSNFLEEIFNTANAATPGLVGLKLVTVPAGTVKSMNAWPQTFGTGSGDWRAGTTTERGGFSMISGIRSLSPDHPGQQIGHVPSTPQDFRMSVGAGPVTLGPGETVSITVAIIIAPPVAGEYVSGQVIGPGGPTTADRQIRRIAGNLFEKARTLVAP
jgi:hypothetical protein